MVFRLMLLVTLALTAGPAHAAPAPASAQAPDAAPDADAAPAPDAAPADAAPAVDAAPAAEAAPAPEAASPDAAAPEPAPDPHRWGAWLQGGLAFTLLEDSPLGEQLSAAGYAVDMIGPSFGVGLERFVLDWLVVGGRLDLRTASGDRSADRFSGSLARQDTTELWYVTGGAYVQPTFCLEYSGCRHDGFWMGVQLGVAAGPTWWVLRDTAELGVHVRLEGALLWMIAVDDVLFGFRLAHAGLWQSGLGPRDLGHGLLWLPATDIRVGYRW